MKFLQFSLLLFSVILSPLHATSPASVVKWPVALFCSVTATKIVRSLALEKQKLQSNNDPQNFSQKKSFFEHLSAASCQTLQEGGTLSKQFFQHPIETLQNHPEAILLLAAATGLTCNDVVAFAQSLSEGKSTIQREKLQQIHRFQVKWSRCKL